MSFNLISLIILVFSFLGMVFLVVKKIPALTSLKINPALVADEGFFVKIKNRIQEVPWVKNFSLEIFLQKIISPIRVLSLKADHKTANWLKTLREKSQQKKTDNGDYWEDLKKSKHKK